MPRPAKVLRLAAPVAVLALMGAACSSSSSKSSSSSSGSSTSGSSGSSGSSASAPTTVVNVSGTLNGSGSTFQQPYEQVVIQAFQQAHSGATVNYQGKGSGGGQTDLGNQVVDFAGSDVPESATQATANKGGPILYFPIALGPVTVPYNLPGNPRLNLDGTVLAKIFTLKITKWNDPAIAADGNSGLPNLPITVVHRSDSSGTTANFTSFLSKADASDWTQGSTKTPTWPAGTVAGNGNAGVASAIKGKSGAIGYVDFSDATATGVTWAKIKNASGAYIDATLDGASAAAADATPKADLTFDPIFGPGAKDYPITSPTYVITYAKYADAGKVALLKAFLSFVLGQQGQGLTNQQSLGFAPLPASLAQKAVAQVDQIAAG